MICSLMVTASHWLHIGSVLGASQNLAQDNPAMNAHGPAEEPNEPNADVNVPMADHPEVVDAMTNEHVAFHSQQGEGHLRGQEQTT